MDAHFASLSTYITSVSSGVYPRASVKLRPAANTPHDGKQACWILNMILGTSACSTHDIFTAGTQTASFLKRAGSGQALLLCGNIPSLLLLRINGQQAFCTGLPGAGWWLVRGDCSLLRDFPVYPCHSISYPTHKPFFCLSLHFFCETVESTMP